MRREPDIHRSPARRVSRFAVTVGAALLICVAAPAARTWAQGVSVDHRAIAVKTLENHIRPGYARLAEAAKDLAAKSGTFCDAPSPAGREAVEKAFASTVLAWGHVEHLRFGPIMQEHRHERMAFWPDPKGIGSRQIASELKDQDKEVLDPRTLAGKSVAVQGLTALERLLHGDGNEELFAPTQAGRFRCGYAKGIAGNLAGIAAAVHDAWAGNAGFAAAMLEPGPDKPLYRSGKEVTQELHKAFSTGLERLKDVKLARALGDSFERARAQRAPFWRSGLALPFMAANAAGLREQFAKGGFAELLAADSPGIDQSVLFDFNRIVDTLASFNEPILVVLEEKQGWDRLHALLPALTTIRDTGAKRIAAAAGLTLGFNSLDGD